MTTQNKRVLETGKGPYILLRDGEFGHLDAKFPDQGSWPFSQLLESYAMDMPWIISDANLSRYLVVLLYYAIPSQYTADENRFFLLQNRRHICWNVPEDLSRQCPVPYLWYNVWDTTNNQIYFGGSRPNMTHRDKLGRVSLRYLEGKGQAAPDASATPGVSSRITDKTGLLSGRQQAVIEFGAFYTDVYSGSIIPNKLFAVSALFFPATKADFPLVVEG